MMGSQNRNLTAAQRDRATGAVVAMAVGNALGAGYAFQPRPLAQDVELRGGGMASYAAGEWVDDTAMAIPLLDALARGRDLLDPQTQDEVVAAWVRWRGTTDDVAPVIDEVLRAYDPQVGAQSLRRAALQHFDASATSAGNASLMRTTPITLGYLHDPDGLARAARTYSDLTHGNPEAGDACVLWNLAQRHAIIHGEFDVAIGLPWIPQQRQALWAHLITQAEVGPPEDFAVRNAWVTQVLQTAWSAISHCSTPGPEHLEQTLRVAVASGGDTATVAAVVGGLLGARWGVSAIPLQWRRQVFGWPGYRDADLVEAVERILPGPVEMADGSARAVVHPRDAGMLIGGVGGLTDLPSEVDAVVSLCSVPKALAPDVPPDDHVRVWLVDSADPQDNPNLPLVVSECVDLLVSLRAADRVVYLHCDDGLSRMPFIATMYAAHHSETDWELLLAEIEETVDGARPNDAFMRFLHQFG